MARMMSALSVMTRPFSSMTGSSPEGTFARNSAGLSPAASQPASPYLGQTAAVPYANLPPHAFRQSCTSLDRLSFNFMQPLSSPQQRQSTGLESTWAERLRFQAGNDGLKEANRWRTERSTVAAHVDLLDAVGDALLLQLQPHALAVRAPGRMIPVAAHACASTKGCTDRSMACNSWRGQAGMWGLACSISACKGRHSSGTAAGGQGPPVQLQFNRPGLAKRPLQRQGVARALQWQGDAVKLSRSALCSKDVACQRRPACSHPQDPVGANSIPWLAAPQDSAMPPKLARCL